MSPDILSAKLVDVNSVVDSSSVAMPIAGKGRREVSAFEAEAFSRLLADPSVSGVMPAAKSSAAPTMKTPVLGGVASAEAPATPLLGDTLLDGLQKVGADARQQLQEVTNLAQAHNVSPSELLAAQAKLSKVVFANELTATVIKKVSTVVDSIVHMQ